MEIKIYHKLDIFNKSCFESKQFHLKILRKNKCEEDFYNYQLLKDFAVEFFLECKVKFIDVVETNKKGIHCEPFI